MRKKTPHKSAPEDSEKIRQRRIFWLAVLIVGFSYIGVATYGTFELFAPEVRSQSFDDLAASILHGKANVQPEHIEAESYTIGTETYMNFSPWPALLRLPLNMLFPFRVGQWPRVSCLLAASLAIAGFVWFLRIEGNLVSFRMQIALLFLFAFGSPLFFLISCTYLYHEPMLWGCAWCALGLAAASRALTFPDLRWPLWFLSICAAGALLSRVTFALSMGCLLGLIFSWHFFSDPTFKTFKKLGAMLLPFLGALTFHAWYNYARFGSILKTRDERYYYNFIYLPEQWEAYQRSGAFNVGRLGIGIAHYFGFGSHYFLSHFPYIVPAGFTYDPDLYLPGYREWAVPLSLSASWLCLGALLGLAMALSLPKQIRSYIPLCFLPSAVVVLGFFYVSQRYSADFLPLLVSLFAVCLRQRQEILESFRNRRIIYALLIIAGICSVVITVLGTLSWNIRDNWALPQAYREYLIATFGNVEESP